MSQVHGSRQGAAVLNRVVGVDVTEEETFGDSVELWEGFITRARE